MLSHLLLAGVQGHGLFLPDHCVARKDILFPEHGALVLLPRLFPVAWVAGVVPEGRLGLVHLGLA